MTTGILIRDLPRTHRILKVDQEEGENKTQDMVDKCGTSLAAAKCVQHVSEAYAQERIHKIPSEGKRSVSLRSSRLSKAQTVKLEMTLKSDMRSTKARQNGSSHVFR